jgi:predicted GNAT family acetyltransferase
MAGGRMSAIHIDREETPIKARYAGTVEGHEGEAELTYSRARDDLVIADHTFAPDSLRGTGVAGALVERLIADARAEGFKIIPLCPYVKSQFEKHPEWADVLRAT